MSDKTGDPLGGDARGDFPPGIEDNVLNLIRIQKSISQNERKSATSKEKFKNVLDRDVTREMASFTSNRKAGRSNLWSKICQILKSLAKGRNQTGFFVAIGEFNGTSN